VHPRPRRTVVGLPINNAGATARAPLADAGGNRPGAEFGMIRQFSSSSRRSSPPAPLLDHHEGDRVIDPFTDCAKPRRGATRLPQWGDAVPAEEFRRWGKEMRRRWSTGKRWLSALPYVTVSNASGNAGRAPRWCWAGTPRSSGASPAAPGSTSRSPPKRSSVARNKTMPPW
jgi:hypothetical protein